MADPRWPHFSVAYQSYLGDDELKNVGATRFGETFPLYSGNAFERRWITGIQAAVFAFFNLDADSMDLINADYRVEIPVPFRKDNLFLLFIKTIFNDVSLNMIMIYWYLAPDYWEFK